MLLDRAEAWHVLLGDEADRRALAAVAARAPDAVEVWLRLARQVEIHHQRDRVEVNPLQLCGFRSKKISEGPLTCRV